MAEYHPRQIHDRYSIEPEKIIGKTIKNCVFTYEMVMIVFTDDTFLFGFPDNGEGPEIDFRCPIGSSTLFAHGIITDEERKELKAKEDTETEAALRAELERLKRRLGEVPSET